jgi:hypothetical protein
MPLVTVVIGHRLLPSGCSAGTKLGQSDGVCSIGARGSMLRHVQHPSQRRERHQSGTVRRNPFCKTAGRLHELLGELATDLATEHGGTDANERDAVRQLGRLNNAELQL